MNKTLCLFIFWGLILAQIACGQTQPKKAESKTPTKTEQTKTDYPNLKAQAEDATKATLEGNFGKVVDYTHPKIIEKLGGKEKMAAFLEQDSQQMKTDGFEIVSVEIGEIKKIEKVENELFALIPMKMTVKTPNGKGVSESSMIGISINNGENWKFISGVSQDRFKAVFPKAAERIQIPEERSPAIIEN